MFPISLQDIKFCSKITTVQMLKQKLNPGVLKQKLKSKELMRGSVQETAPMPGVGWWVPSKPGRLWHALIDMMSPRSAFAPRSCLLLLSPRTPTLSLPLCLILKFSVMESEELKNGFLSVPEEGRRVY